MSERAQRAQTIGILLLLGLLVGAVLVWRLSVAVAVVYNLDDTTLHADGFYPAERSDGDVRFRWSRPSAGFLLPALAARQVVTLELSAPRPANVPPPTGIRLEANGVTVPLTFAPGWATYTITAPSQIGLENAVALVATTYADSFYPSAGDNRHLTVAVQRVSITPAPSLGGLPLPAPLPGAIALLLPALVWGIARRWGPREAWLLTLIIIVGIEVALALLPLIALPSVLLVAGVVGALVLAVSYADKLNTDSVDWPGLSTARKRRLAALAEVGGPILLFTVLALIATWPLATQLSTALPGWPGDNFAFLYKIWWVATALGNGANPFFDPNVFAPFGFNFGRGEPTLPNTVPGALIDLAGGGPVLGYNLVLLAGFVGSGLGMMGLARAVGASRPAALLAGIVFMLAPFRLAQAAGHLQIAATQWLPLTLWAAERALQRRRACDTALTGLCYALTALTAWYYALIGGLLLMGYVALRLVQMRQTFPWRTAVRPALVGALVAGVVLLPGLVPALAAAGDAPMHYSAKAADENSASPEDYLIPNELHPLGGADAMQAHAQQNIIEDVLYPGWVAGLLAAVALAARRTRGRAWVWAVLIAGCAALSLGLYLHTATGGLAQVGGGPLPLPGWVLYNVVPGFSSLRAWARFGIGVTLGVAVLAGLGTTWLLAQPWLARWRSALAAGLVGLVLFDFWSAPTAWGLTTVQPNAVAGWLAAQPPGAVIQLPLTSAVAGPPLYAGTAYGHPLAYGYETFEPPGFSVARPTLAAFPSPAAFALLRQWGVRYVVVAASSYGAQWAAQRAYFAGLLDWTEAYAAPQPVVYHAPFWVGEVRTELRDAFAPDELVVYRLK